MWGAVIAGAAQVASSALANSNSSTGGVELAPPALGYGARKGYQDELAAIMMNLSRGKGGFGPNWLGQQYGQMQSMLAPAMAQANQRLDFANMKAGIFDSGVAAQGRSNLQGMFMSSLNKNLMDTVLQGEMQKRGEMMQGLQMMLSGINVGGAYQTPGGMNNTGVLAQSVGGGIQTAMNMYAMQNMFGRGGNDQQQTSYGYGQNVKPPSGMGSMGTGKDPGGGPNENWGWTQ